MKIAIIGSKGVPAKYGGVQVVVENVAKELVKMGHEVTIFSRKYYTQKKEKIFFYDNIRVINIHGINTKRLDTLSHSFISSIKAAVGNYDLVVFHSIVPGIFAFIPKIFKNSSALTWFREKYKKMELSG